MRRLCGCVIGSFLLFVAPEVRAQHSQTPQPPPAVTNEPALDDQFGDLKQAVLLQATARQASQFSQFVQSTAKARMRARDVAARAMADVVHGADPLIDLLDDVQWDGAHFLSSFSQAQRSGLKPLTKKMARAKKDVDEHAKELKAGRSAGNEAQIVMAAGKVDEALAKFEVRQRDVGRQMGISLDGEEQ
jgi:hypothetical protein